METLFKNEFVKVSHIRQPGKHVCLCFTGVGHQMGGKQIQNEEFKKIESNIGDLIFISDLKRSWGNNLDFNFLHQLLNDLTLDKKIYCIGNSMGAFLAIIATKFWNIDVAICFSPQFEVSNDIRPKRWHTHPEEIPKSFTFSSLEGYFSSDTQYYLFSGYKDFIIDHDRRQWEAFPIEDNIHNFVLKGVSHQVAADVKKNNLLYDLIHTCLIKGKPRKILKSHYKFHNIAAIPRDM